MVRLPPKRQYHARNGRNFVKVGDGVSNQSLRQTLTSPQSRPSWDVERSDAESVTKSISPPSPELAEQLAQHPAICLPENIPEELPPDNSPVAENLPNEADETKKQPGARWDHLH